MDINLHQLRIFHAVAEHGSYSRAAAALYLSQPGVSLQVKALEKSIGLPLFEKVGRTLHLTAAGTALLGYSEKIFGLLEETRLVMEELSGGRRGTVKVAASTTAGIYVVPRVLGAFHREFPGIKLTLDVHNRLMVQKRLLDNEVDMAVMGLIEDTHDLEVAQYLPNELVVIASPRHPMAERRTIPVAELSEETFLLREVGSGTRIDTQRLFEGRDLKLNVGMELRSSGAIKQGVAADLGIAVIPLGAIELEIGAERLVVLDVTGFPVHRHWYLARRAGSHPSAAAAALWNFMMEYRNKLVTHLTQTRGASGVDAHEDERVDE